MSIHVLGIRHHGPGSARSVLSALAELEPDLVVIEGAPELDALVDTADDPDLVPPVAALVYAVDTPRRSAFYPLAEFSPEWVAMRWAVARSIPVRFADLPAAHVLADAVQESEDADEGEQGASEVEEPRRVGVRAHRPDAIGTLAAAAGYDDPERWWEDAVEHRTGSTLATFDDIRAAMAEVRIEVEDDEETLVREAAMRRVLRAVLKEGAERVAFVCGAYHAPAVHPATWPAASADTRLLTKLPRAKVKATWAPWTSARLAVRSGYGAGVTSPGWYRYPLHLVAGAGPRRCCGRPRPRRGVRLAVQGGAGSCASRDSRLRRRPSSRRSGWPRPWPPYGPVRRSG